MLNKTFVTARAMFAAPLMLLLNACLYGEPIVSPVHVVVASHGLGTDTQQGSVIWPFENNPQDLRLKCEGDKFFVELSTANARITIRDEALALKRDFFVHDRFSYWQMSNEQDFFVDDIDYQEFKVDRFTLLSQGKAELYYEGMLIACNYDPQGTLPSVKH